MAGTKGSWRDGAFSALARWGTQHPWRVLGVILMVLVVFAAALPGLSVSTSRTNMVSDEDPQQRRMNAFYERFGRPDYPLFVVSGGSAEQRRAVVDALTAAVEEDHALVGRTFGRIEPQEVASIILLQRPAALSELAAGLPPGQDAAALVEGGLQRWLDALAGQLEAGLEGGDDAAAGGGMEKAAEGLGQLAALAGTLEAVAKGEDLLSRFEGQASFEREGVDARGYVVTADGEHHLLAIYAEIDSDEGRVLAPLVDGLREARDRVMADGPPGVTAELTGLPALAVDELRIVQDGLLITSIAATIGIFGLCLLLFRSLRQTIVALLPLAPGILGTLAVVRVLYDDLNIITSGFVAVLLGLGIDFSVHIIARRNEEIRLGQSPAQAIEASLRRTGPGIFTGAVVTAAAFLTNGTTEFTAYGELGVVTAVGLLLMVMITFAVIPPLLTIGKNSEVRVAPEPPGLAALPGLLRRAKLLVLGAALALAAAGGVAVSGLQYNARYFDFLPEATESALGLNVLEYDAVASPVFAAIPAESIDAAREKTAALRALPSVAGLQSPSDLLPPLDAASLSTLRAGLRGLGRAPDVQALAAAKIEPAKVATQADAIADLLEEVAFAMRGAGMDTQGADAAKDAFASLAKTLASLDAAGTARVEGINAQAAAILGPAMQTAAAVAERGDYAPEDLPPLFASRFVSKDRKSVAIFVVPSGQFWEEDVALTFAADVRSVDENAVGLAMVHVEHGRQVREGFERAALYAAGLIVLLLLADFRSLKDSLLALFPTVLGWLWMLGLMPLMGMDFNVANIVALPLVLGIGIAFGVHMMHRLREGDGDAETPSLDSVVRGTGGAIGVAATTTMVGFAALMLSPYGGMISLGATMVLGIGACLLATLLVLPALLLVLARAR